MHYYFNITLVYVTLDKCCSCPFCSINIALLMLQVVTSSCKMVSFRIFGIALLHYVKVSLFNSYIDCCTSRAIFLLSNYVMLHFNMT